MKKTLQECKEIVVNESNLRNIFPTRKERESLIDLANKMYYEQSEDESEYELHFGSALKAKIKISNNIIEVIGAVDGWGNDVKSSILIEPLPSPPKQ